MKLVQLLKSKIHRATVTDAQVDYVGSIGIDQELLNAVGIVPGELVHVWVVDNGERFQTYAIPTPPGSGDICVYGAAAHKVRTGYKVIIASFALADEPVEPQVILVDENNKFLKKLPFQSQPIDLSAMNIK